jgi:hypothetical protein
MYEFQKCYGTKRNYSGKGRNYILGNGISHKRRRKKEDTTEII